MMPTVYGTALSSRIARALDEFDRAGQAYLEFHTSKRRYQSNPIFSMEISFKRLAAYIALYEQHSVSAAANLLGITNAAVYNSTRQLEELLEVPLFQKQPHGVAPTPFCDILARHIKLAFSQIRHGLEDIADLNGTTQGKVLIGTLPYTRTKMSLALLIS